MPASNASTLPTPRQRFVDALELRPAVGPIPHFELVFFPTMQVFGKVHPGHRNYNQWGQFEASEKQLHRADIARLHIDVAERYGHDAIFVHPNPHDMDEIVRLIDLIREWTGDRFFLMLHGDATFAIPDGDGMVEFSYRMIDEPDALKTQAQQQVDQALKRAEQLRERTSLDGFALCSDYCFNTGPFLSPDQFGEFIAPYLQKLIAGYRDMGFYAIKHTDGNIMPIIDQLIDARPHALHSLDPQGQVDIAEVKRRYGDQVALCGNVNCGTLDRGTEEQVAESVRYALKHGSPGGGYIFCTSNCIYPGMPVERYEYMLSVRDQWEAEHRPQLVR